MMISDATSRGPKRSARKRVGRGRGCGWGKTSGRGAKGAGQHATRSNGQKATSEGGQLPLFRRLPKRGFSNAQFRTEYQVVNVSDLQERFEDGAHITATLLKEAGLIHDAKRPVKILGDGQISKRFQVEVTQFSQTAAKKIADAGGQAKAESKAEAKAEGKAE